MTRLDKVPFVRGLHTYSGSCRCGAIRFEADLDLEASGTARCNCTYCTKTAWWGVLVKPDAFRVLSEAGVEDTRRAPYGTRRVCDTCFIVPFGYGDIPELGGPYVSINVRALDGVDLTGVRVNYHDGLADTWALLGTRPYEEPFAKAAGG